jgi:hypothetical protein
MGGGLELLIRKRAGHFAGSFYFSLLMPLLFQFILPGPGSDRVNPDLII